MANFLKSNKQLVVIVVMAGTAAAEKRWSLWQKVKTAMTGAVKFLKKQAVTISQQQNDCKKEKKCHCSGISMPWYNNMAMTLVAPYPFSLPNFGRVNYPYPGNYPVIFFVTA